MGAADERNECIPRVRGWLSAAPMNPPIRRAVKKVSVGGLWPADTQKLGASDCPPAGDWASVHYEEVTSLPLDLFGHGRAGDRQKPMS